jgi:hypothetical protein
MSWRSDKIRVIRGRAGRPGPKGEPGDANLTKSAIEAVLIGEISSHSHAGGGITEHENTYNHLNIHALNSDNQDLSDLQKKIIFSETEPENPELNDLWIDTS